MAIVSVGAVALGLVGLTALPAHAQPTDVAEAEGQLLSGNGTLDLDTLAALKAAYSATPSGQAVSNSTLDLTALGGVLGGINLDLGSGVQLPSNTNLSSLLDVGVDGQHAATTAAGAAHAAAGALTQGGAIATAAGGDATKNTTVTLTPLLGSVSGASNIATDLTLELGAIAAQADETGGASTAAGQYEVSGGKLTLHSPLVSTLNSNLSTTLSGATSTINGALGSTGAVNAITGSLGSVTTALSDALFGLATVSNVNVAATIDSADLSNVLSTVGTVSSGGVSINLAAGTISVDLGTLLGNGDGTLNGLPANTHLLTGSTVSNLLNGAINDALTALVNKVDKAVTDQLNATHVNVVLTADVKALGGLVGVATLDLEATGTVGQLLSGTPPFTVADNGSNLLTIIPVGSLLTAVTDPLLQNVLPVVGTQLQTAITGLTGTVGTLGTQLGSALGNTTSGLLAVVNQVVDIVVNVQEKPGDFTTATAGTPDLTERALQLNLLPAAGAVSGTPLTTVNLASASVRGTVKSTTATITATPASVPAGSTETITGSGFAASQQVTLTFTDASGAVLGTATTTPNSSGAINTTWPVPAGTAAGTVKVTATQGDTTSGGAGFTATTTFQVTTGGTATAGTATAGTATSGSATTGTATSGTATAGTASSGTDTTGTASSGTATSGTATSGTSTAGTATSGTATAGTATAGTATSGSTGVIKPGTPTITGQTQVGGTLVGHPGTWSPSGTTLTYKWTLPNGTVIGTQQTLIVPTSAAGKTVRLTVTGSKPGYTSVSNTATAQIGSNNGPQVIRIWGQDRYQTALTISQDTFPVNGSAPVVFVASGENFPDALSAAPAAAKLGGPLLLTPKNSVSTALKNEIKRLGAQKIIVVGGTSALTGAVSSALSKVAPVTRLGGADRYATSQLVAKYAFGSTNVPSAFVATGANFPDALSASAYAGQKKEPVLLVNSGSAASVGTFLKRAKTSSLSIAGGTAVVPTSIENTLEKAIGHQAKRFGGADRYQTSQLINKQFTSAPRVYFATGMQFPDALTGAAAAAKLGAPLFVVHPNCVPQPVLNSLKNWKTGTIKVLGGPAALNNNVFTLKSCG